MTLNFAFLFLFIHSSFIGCTKSESGSIAPTIWIKSYSTGNITLSRAFVDEHLALYHDSGINESVRWPQNFLSSAWEYVKGVFGQFGQDPHLYVILRGEPTAFGLGSCDVYPSSKYVSRNVIECTPPSSSIGWALNDTSSIETLVMALGKMVSLGAKGGTNDPDEPVCGRYGLRDIITYDIYRQLTNINHEQFKPEAVENWRISRLKEKMRDHYCFRDWYLPIYETYGGASVLNNYLAITQHTTPWRSKQGQGTREVMTVGEFVHFWSCAVGAELTHLRSNAFSWENHMDEYLIATRTYSQCTYTEKNWDLSDSHHQPGTWLLSSHNHNSSKALKLLYHTPEVAIYSQNFQIFPMSLFEIIAFTWNKMRKESSSSGSFSRHNNTLLYVLLDNDNDNGTAPPGILNKMLYISKDELPREFSHCPSSLFFRDGDGQPLYSSTMSRGRVSRKFRPLELALNNQALSEEASPTLEPEPEPEPETTLTLTWSVAYDIHLNLMDSQQTHNTILPNSDDNRKSTSQHKHIRGTGTGTGIRNVSSFHWSQSWSFNINDRFTGPVRFGNLLNILKSNEGTSTSTSTPGGSGYVLVHESAVLLKNNTTPSFFGTGSYDWSEDILGQLVQKRSKYSGVSYVLEKNPGSTRKHNVVYLNIKSQYKVTQIMTGNDTLTIHYNSSYPALISWPIPLFSTTWTFLLRFARSALSPSSYSTNENGNGVQTLNLRLFETKDKFTKDKRCSFHKTFKLPTKTKSSPGPGPGPDDTHLHNVINCLQPEPKNSKGPNAWSTHILENTVFLAKFIEGQMNFTKIPKDANNFLGQIASCAFKFSVYDMLKNQSRRTDEDMWLNSHSKDRTRLTSGGENGPSINWLQDWCLPLYSQYGGSGAFSRFFALLDEHELLSQNGGWDSTGGNKLIDFGEFIHLWSLAAGSDRVLNLAVDVFGSRKENLVGMMEARHKYNENTGKGKSSPTLAQYLVYQEVTYFEQHYQLMRKSLGNNVTTIYQATSIQSDIAWPLPLISAVWPFLQRYSLSSNSNPTPPFNKLTLIFSTKTQGGCKLMPTLPSSMLNATGEQDLFHVMECGHPAGNSGNVAQYNYENAASLIQQLQEDMDYFSLDDLTVGAVRGGLNTIIYQFFLSNGGHADADRWLLEDEDAKAPLYTSSDKKWLHDWCFPIYEKYGGASSFERFLQLLDKRSKDMGTSTSTSTSTSELLSWGEFVQMWGEATGQDLLGLASKAFPWTDEYSKQFLQATAKSENITNSDNDITRLPYFIISEESLKRPLLMKPIFHDTNVTISSDTPYHYPTLTNWSLSIVSKTLPYIRRFERSGGLNFSESTPHLNLMFHAKLEKGCELLGSIDVTTSQDTIQLDNVIDCGYCNGNKSNDEKTWESPSYKNIELLTKVLRGNGNGTVPIQTDLVGLAVLSSFDLAVYNYFEEEGRVGDAARWLHSGNTQKSRIFGRNKTWLEDWYLPIYRDHGKMAPINKFLHLADKYQGHGQRFESDLKLTNTSTRTETGTGTGTTHQNGGNMNVGEFVHLWSGSIGDCTVVKRIAAMSIGWNQTFQDEFNQARVTMEGLKYAGSNCEDILDRPSENSGVQTSSVTIIAIISIVILVALCLGIKIAVDRKKMRGLKAQIRKLTSEEIHEFRNGKPSNIYEKDGNGKKDEDGNAAIHKLPFNTSYEISKKNLEIDTGSHLGSGEFGVVKKGSIKRRNERGNYQTEVAVKMVKPNVEVTHFKALLSEIKIMAYLGIHKNIASLLGTVTDNIRDCEVLVALEFCAKGDLLQFIRKHEENFINLWNTRKTSSAGIDSDSKCTFKISHGDNNSEAQVKILATPTPTPTQTSDPTSSYENSKQLTTYDLVNWASEIANGMEYISFKKVIHGDLAARNVLLTSDNVAKISDFGLSRQLINYSIYTKETRTPLPWRWMAPESLQEMKFSVHSDIWAFGVTLWEIFTLGRVPYPSRVWDHAFVDSLFAGQRLEAPEFGNGEIEEIMLDCMKNIPKERIDFPQIKARFESLKIKMFPSPKVVYTPL